MRIGVLTGGGDCPGLNAVIRAVVRKGIEVYGHEIIGFRDGWRGPLQRLMTPLGLADVEHILPLGGTILRTSRTNPYRNGGAQSMRCTRATAV
jgi:ATP-dependent phosphofructokinase / diphosphate-dependent phosphofructokinase